MYSHSVPDDTPQKRSANMRCMGCTSGILIRDIDAEFSMRQPVVCDVCGQGHSIELHAIEEYEFFRLAPAA